MTVAQPLTIRDQRRENTVPRILVTTEPIDKPDDGVMLDEHIATSDLASDHFAAQLIERIGWALVDAENTEYRPIGSRAPTMVTAATQSFLRGGPP
jgi:hypothetical protein